MYISRIRLQNWRNFGMQGTEADNLADDVNYIIGPNACGKSNLLDALRFLRDIAKPKGGGLQSAIDIRGGMKKIRCLHATSRTNVIVEVDISDNEQKLWTYTIDFQYPRSGDRNKQELKIKKESAVKYGENDEKQSMLKRPSEQDYEDEFLLRQTHLEQITQNKNFRELADFFSGITYVHLVPQLLKFGDEIGGQVMKGDPFGQAFMQRIAETTKRERDKRLGQIAQALKGLVPGLSQLHFTKDDTSGRPHLQIRFEHFRPKGAFQREDQFSDGTLRLIALLWLLQDSEDSPLLLEEPELSLNEEIVQQIPEMIEKVQQRITPHRQVFITTHSAALLSNPGIGARGIIKVQPSESGSSLLPPDEAEKKATQAGFSPAEAILPKARKGHETLLLDL